MNTKVHALMVANVMTGQPHHTVDRLRRLIDANHVHAIPVVDAEGAASGIVSSTALVPERRVAHRSARS